MHRSTMVLATFLSACTLPSGCIVWGSRAPAATTPMTVRVQDERGAPLPGVQVWAWSTRRVAGFGDEMDLTELAGIATTQADGQVSFRVARPRGTFFIAEKAGWPAQRSDGGMVVLGPSRSVKGHVTIEAPCKTSSIPVGAYPQWWN